MNFDCTPFIVNKTAMYRIVKDTVRAMDVDEMNLTVLGRQTTLNKLEKAGLPVMLKWLFRFSKIGYAAIIFLQKLNLNIFEKKGPTVFFDPLYCIFKKNIDHDFVWVLDLTPYTLPEFHNPAVAFLYRMAFEKISSSSCLLISISQSTTNDMRVNLGIPDERIQTIDLYASISKIKESKKNDQFVGKKFFLFVGSLEHRKNLVSLIRAFSLSRLNESGFSLVITGLAANAATKVIDEMNYVSDVYFLGYVPDSELLWLYEHCYAFVYPSLWEGFGVPLLEAMNCGCVCLSTFTAASKAVGGDAVLYCDPCDVRSIVSGLKKIADLDKQQYDFIKEKSKNRSQSYSFEKYLKQLKNILLLERN